jgi:hypothetical protein
MKRILLVLSTVVTLAVVTLVGGVVPAAFGTPTITSGCIIHSDRPGGIVVTNAGQIPALARYDRNGDNIVCGYSNDFNELHFTDNTHKS